MQQLWFIYKPITQHVSDTTVPIFRSARLYTTAYGFQHCKRKVRIGCLYCARLFVVLSDGWWSYVGQTSRSFRLRFQEHTQYIKYNSQSAYAQHILHNQQIIQIIPDIIFPSRLGPSSWSSCEWFPFVYSFYCASFGRSICASKPTQLLCFNIIYFVPVFN